MPNETSLRFYDRQNKVWVSIGKGRSDEDAPSKSVADASVGVQGTDLLHLVLSQLKVIDLNVFLDVGKLATSRNRNGAPGHTPIEHDLRLGLAVFGANRIELRVFEELGVLDSADAGDWSIGNRDDIL